MSFAEVLAEDLNISIDSAYRRIRSDTNLTFEEIRILCMKYSISVDAFFSASSENVPFKYRALNYQGFTIEKYIQSLLHNLETLHAFEGTELIYTAKDIPLFHLFHYRSLTAFKVFFWKTHYFSASKASSRFDLSDISDRIIELAGNVADFYHRISSLEIWSHETINHTLKQIHYAFKQGMLDSHNAITICNDLISLLEALKMMAAKGFKGGPEDKIHDNRKAAFQMYQNNLTIAENTVFYRMGDMQLVHLGHNILNILSTTNKSFCEHTYSIIKNIINHSIELGGMDAEADREAFFDQLMDKTVSLKNSLVEKV